MTCQNARVEEESILKHKLHNSHLTSYDQLISRDHARLIDHKKLDVRDLVRQPIGEPQMA